MSFSIEERTSCVLWYTETESIVTTQRRFVQKFGKKITPPSNKSIKKWHRKLKSTGTVEKPRAHQPTVLDPQPIIDHFKGNPKTSLRRAANILNISHVSVHNILKKHKFHPYKVKIVQELHANDYAARMAFADEMLDKILHSQDFLQHLMFSDEAHFHIHGGVNTHNCRYWYTENPHWTAEKPLHSPRTTVWAAIWDGGIIGPVFFDTNVNGDNYLNLLQSEFWPAFSILPDSKKFIFMQDGAPPHWSRTVRQWLNENLPNRWIGRGSDGDTNIRWPPRSPDLTPCDFFLWGFIKSKVYRTQPKDINELKTKIRQAFSDVTTEMLHNTMASFQNRLNLVTQNYGRQTEI